MLLNHSKKKKTFGWNVLKLFSNSHCEYLLKNDKHQIETNFFKKIQKRTCWKVGAFIQKRSQRQAIYIFIDTLQAQIHICTFMYTCSHKKNFS